MSSTSITTTRSVLTELLRRIGTGQPDLCADLYADRVDWLLDWPDTELGRAETPWIRSRSTRADVRDHYASVLEHHVPDEVATQVERVLVDGSDAVVLGEIRQTARSTGRPYRARFALHLTIEGGLITRHHVYEDSLAVAQAFAPAPDGSH